MTVHAVLTRQELYDRVWQIPMVKLAAEYGLSGRGLAKLCARHGIPVPGRGHWAVTKAGYEVERDPLPNDPPPETKIQITGDPGHEEEEHPEVGLQIAYETQHPIVVPDRLTRTHRLVALTHDAFQSRQPDRTGILWARGAPLNVSVSSRQLPRALRICDSLLKACEERGFPAVVGREQDSCAKIEVHGEELEVGIREHSKRTDHVLNRQEEKERSLGRGWSIPRYDYSPTGVLTFTIDEYGRGLRCRWSDQNKRPIESRMNEIIVALVRISVTVLKPRRIEAERRHHLWPEEEERRRIYRVKTEALTENLKKWQENQQLRGFIAAIEDAAQKRWGASPSATPIAGWLRWARETADASDPLGHYLSWIEKEESQNA